MGMQEPDPALVLRYLESVGRLAGLFASTFEKFKRLVDEVSALRSRHLRFRFSMRTVAVDPGRRERIDAVDRRVEDALAQYDERKVAIDGWMASTDEKIRRLQGGDGAAVSIVDDVERIAAFDELSATLRGLSNDVEQELDAIRCAARDFDALMAERHSGPAGD